MPEFTRDLRVNRALRKEFSKPFGTILKTKDVKRKIPKEKTIYAIGDMTVATLLGFGYLPKLAIFDYKIERTPKMMPIIKSTYKKPIVVHNKRGFIGVKLWKVVAKASKMGSGVGIRVYGEEDLASLACIYFARNGDIVMYGLPGKGMAAIKVDRDIKNYVTKALKTMSKSQK